MRHGLFLLGAYGRLALRVAFKLILHSMFHVIIDASEMKVRGYMSSNFVKAIRSQEGFSLVQVLVSVAVMAVVMAGTATMMQQMGRSQKTQDSRASYMTLSGAIRSQLLRKETCLASLTAGVPNLTTVTDTSSHDITVFVDPMTVAANANLPD